MKRRINTGLLFFGAALLLSVFVTSHLKASAVPAASAEVASLSASADDGAALFQRNCAVCHGKDGKGLPNWKAKGQPDFTDAKWQKAHTDAQISSVIQNGKGRNMPAFKSRLSDGDVSAIIAQVRAFGKK